MVRWYPLAVASRTRLDGRGGPHQAPRRTWQLLLLGSPAGGGGGGLMPGLAANFTNGTSPFLPEVVTLTGNALLALSSVLSGLGE